VGVPAFAPPQDDEFRPYWDAIGEGRLLLPACARCDRVWWYPLADTPCHPGAGYVWVEAPTEGTVHTFSTVHRNFLPGDAGAAPYMVGLVEPDGLRGVRIVALLQGLPDEQDVIGARVTFAPVASSGYSVPAYAPAAPS
jgi:uncharacterized OB-fold protein